MKQDELFSDDKENQNPYQRHSITVERLDQKEKPKE